LAQAPGGKLFFFCRFIFEQPSVVGSAGISYASGETRGREQRSRQQAMDAVYDCGYTLSDFFSFFLVSGVAEAFGKGNPKYVAELNGLGLTMERLLHLYPTLHEADLTKFVTVADHVTAQNAAGGVTNLQRIRKAAGMTQKGLADESDVSLRMVQLYEQKNKDINKAGALTLAKIARVLGCRIEDLLENELPGV